MRAKDLAAGVGRGVVRCPIDVDDRIPEHLRIFRNGKVKCKGCRWLGFSFGDGYIFKCAGAV